MLLEDQALLLEQGNDGRVQEGLGGHGVGSEGGGGQGGGTGFFR